MTFDGFLSGRFYGLPVQAIWAFVFAESVLYTFKMQ